MQMAMDAAARAHAWTRSLRSGLNRLFSKVIGEVSLIVDLPRWRQAGTPAERLAALSWPRVGVFVVLPLSVIAGALSLQILTRADAYPPADPNAREIAARELALRNSTNSAPASLVEANKSWKAE